MATPSIFSSHTNRTGSSGSPLATRAPHARSSSAVIALSRLIIGTECTTGANSALGAAPTWSPAASGADELRVLRFELAQLARQQVEVGVGDLRVVLLVVALVVVGDERAERRHPLGGVDRFRRNGVGPGHLDSCSLARPGWRVCGRPGRSLTLRWCSA